MFLNHERITLRFFNGPELGSNSWEEG